MADYELRPLGLGGILDQSFKLIRDRFALLMGIALVFYIPLAIAVWWLISSALSGAPESMDSERVAKTIITFSAVGGIVGLAAYLAVNAAVTWAVASVYLGRPTGMGEALGVGLKKLPILVLASIVFALGAGVLPVLAGVAAVFTGDLGILLLLIAAVPAIYMSFHWFLYTQTIVIESQGPISSLNRSGELMRGRKLRLFALLLLLMILSFLLESAVGMVAGQAVNPETRQINLSSQLIGSIVKAVLMVISATVSVVFYYSARCEAENFDLEVLAADVGVDSLRENDAVGSSSV